jgi:hypothetical protein
MPRCAIGTFREYSENTQRILRVLIWKTRSAPAQPPRPELELELELVPVLVPVLVLVLEPVPF